MEAFCPGTLEQPSKSTLEALAKRTRQEALRAYLAEQVEMQRTAKAKAKELDKMYQEHQKASYEAWKSYEDRQVAAAAERKARYRAELDRQAAQDATRKAQARAFAQLPATSTGPGLGTGTLRQLGADLPYDLVETPELGTIGVTLRYAVVLKDGQTLPKRKRNQLFIE